MALPISRILLCVFAGVFLCGAWWVFGDGVIQFRRDFGQKTSYVGHWVVPGVLSFVGMLGLNIGVTPARVYARWEARLWMFGCLTLAFVGMGLAIWILSVDELIGGGQNWTGISLLVQTMLLFLAGLLFFVRDGVMQTDNSYKL